MAVSAVTVRSDLLVGNGLATRFAFSFAAASADEVAIEAASSLGAFTVSLNADRTGSRFRCGAAERRDVPHRICPRVRAAVGL